jgi:hypothetical protein
MIDMDVVEIHEMLDKSGIAPGRMIDRVASLLRLNNALNESNRFLNEQCLKMQEVKTFASDTQVGGDHYRKLAVQPWDAMQAWMTPEEFRGFLRGCVIKYVARKKHEGTEDFEKARHFLAKLIEVWPKAYREGL